MLGCHEEEAATLLRAAGTNSARRTVSGIPRIDAASSTLQRVTEVTDWAGNMTPEELRERLSRVIACEDPWAV